jgi:hypothetical protein
MGIASDDGEKVILTRRDGRVANPIEKVRGTNHTYDNMIFTVSM